MNISWASSPGAESYRVMRKASGSRWKTIKSSATELSFIDTDVTWGEKYYYLVRSQIGGVLNDNWSSTVQSITIPMTDTPMPMPVGIDSLDYTSSSVTVSWAESSDAQSYRVLRKADNETEWTTVKQSTTALQFKDTDVSPGHTYTYLVRSQIAGVFSEMWEHLAQSVTIPATPPPVPITSLTYSDGAVSVYFSKGPNAASGYFLYRKAAGGSWKRILDSYGSDIYGSSFYDTNVTPGTKYYYVVRASNYGILSENWSSTVQSITID